MEECQLDSSGSGYGKTAGCYERGNKPYGYLQFGEFHDKPSYYQLVKKQLVAVLQFEPVGSLTNAVSCIVPSCSLAGLML
jgi:hypothetical protein